VALRQFIQRCQFVLGGPSKLVRDLAGPCSTDLSSTSIKFNLLAK
jgi:hypothetical protein